MPQELIAPDYPMSDPVNIEELCNWLSLHSLHAVASLHLLKDHQLYKPRWITEFLGWYIGAVEKPPKKRHPVHRHFLMDLFEQDLGDRERERVHFKGGNCRRSRGITTMQGYHCALRRLARRMDTIYQPIIEGRENGINYKMIPLAIVFADQVHQTANSHLPSIVLF